ncbi:MAG TPA: hypothetical protein VFD39_13965 [Trueperaceae bacterium]|nr:hypothetical protein [Trueperaceae bacterium]
MNSADDLTNTATSTAATSTSATSTSVTTSAATAAANGRVSSPAGDGSSAVSRPVFAERVLPRPAPGPVTDAWRIFVKAIHSLAVVAMGSAAFYLMYCAISGRRDVFTVLALVMIGVEAVIYATFGRKCPLTILARNLGDDGGHDYLFEWILGTTRIKYVARTLALLSVVGVLMLIIASLIG